ncbi:unnamed protein product [Cunninghamella blakesleeana]
MNNRILFCIEIFILFVLHPWLFIQNKLNWWLKNPLWTAIMFLILFPMVVTATLISKLLRLFINHMVQHRVAHTSTNNNDSYIRLSSNSPSSSSSSSSLYPSSSSIHNNASSSTTTITTTTTTTTTRTIMSSSSSNASSPQDDFSYWIERCSICFDSRLDLCLDYCRDQFCLDCFRRYVTEVVHSSWGLSVKKIKCPVCSVHIPQSEWSKYVPDSTVELYNKFNRPFRSYTRCCPDCETEVTACEYTKNQTLFHHRDNQRSKLIQEMIKDLLLSCKQKDHSHSDIQSILKTYEYQDWRNSTLLSVHQRTISSLLSFVNHHVKDNTLTPKIYAISRHILLLDMKPETWKRLQFSHISYFPNIDCTNTSCRINFCLQCGYKSHKDRTCEENMQQMIYLESNDSDPIRWKLENSKRCPSCSILITRDEGCNKVDCSLCGFSFCWACSSAWSEKCGFYRCSITGLTEKQIEPSDMKAELGVPDVSFMQSRILSDVN